MYVEKLTQIDMRPKTTLSISEARKNIFKIADEVQKPDTFYTLTENGQPKVIMMSAEEFESWMETMEVMWEFPDLKKDIEEAERDFKSGNYKNYITLDELKNELHGKTKIRAKKGDRKAK